MFLPEQCQPARATSRDPGKNRPGARRISAPGSWWSGSSGNDQSCDFATTAPLFGSTSRSTSLPRDVLASALHRPWSNSTSLLSFDGASAGYTTPLTGPTASLTHLSLPPRALLRHTPSLNFRPFTSL